MIARSATVQAFNALLEQRNDLLKAVRELEASGAFRSFGDETGVDWTRYWQGVALARAAVKRIEAAREAAIRRVIREEAEGHE